MKMRIKVKRASKEINERLINKLKKGGFEGGKFK